MPPVTEKLTTTLEGREALEGMIFIIIGRVILVSSSSTTSPGIACKNLTSIAEDIKQGCVNVENRWNYIILSKDLYMKLGLPSPMPSSVSYLRVLVVCISDDFYKRLL